MSHARVAKRYAKSFLDLSREKGFLEEAYRDMETLHRVASGNRDFRLMLKNPLINPDKKLQILKKLFEGRFHPTTVAFLAIIVKKRREIYFADIANEFTEMYRLIKGITKAILVSAKGVDAEMRTEVMALLKKMTESEISLEEVVSPDVIGGFILKFGDRQYDTTVARSLNLFKAQFSKNLHQSKIWKN